MKYILLLFTLTSCSYLRDIKARYKCDCIVRKINRSEGAVRDSLMNIWIWRCNYHGRYNKWGWFDTTSECRKAMLRRSRGIK